MHLDWSGSVLIFFNTSLGGLVLKLDSKPVKSTIMCIYVLNLNLMCK